jgi:hypothetical protein
MTKYAINQMNYYAKTLPFDWMFSSLLFIQTVMEDNFKELMNMNYIKSNNPYYSKNKSLNILYNKTIIDNVNIFNHFLFKNELKEVCNFHMWNHYNLLEEAQYIKYKKYIDRFTDIISSDDLKLFLYIQYFNEDVNDVFVFNNYLNKTVKNYRFICLNCIKINDKDHFYCTYNENNLSVYELAMDKYDYIPQYHLDKLKIIIDDMETSFITNIF